jgi:hypothetical protein
MLTEIWNITFVCLTLSNPACMKMDGLMGVLPRARHSSMPF